ncbi:hypothetical protein PQO03_18675 [Lentisphaera profundi]|uniref:Uncharacterized protein n=1 Tax=Lentisphaera profundi TaxID=1658616 RepID=A0ABY7VX54_9BACT|nr:hypothetical protein [Lentisphaera profundi]WDE97853.1 hypothetical protein PQO03_18675 [Lentisphaera profundi]
MEIKSKLTSEQWQKFQMAKANITTEACRKYIKEGKAHSSEEWDALVNEITKEALHGKRVIDLIEID